MSRLLKSFLHLRRAPEILECLGKVENPLEMIRRYFNPSSKRYPFEFRYRNGPHIRLNDYHDLVTAWVVFLRKEYLVTSNANSILDIGANIGCFSLFSSIVAKNSRVCAFEPFPETFDHLAENISANSIGDRVFAFQGGIAARSGLRKMVLGNVPSQSRGLSPDTNSLDSIDVKVYCLSEVLDQACDRLNVTEIEFVKIDVEGAEHEAIRASEPWVLRRMQRLAMEYHPNQPKGPLFAHLRDAGFEVQLDNSFGADVGVVHFVRR